MRMNRVSGVRIALSVGVALLLALGSAGCKDKSEATAPAEEPGTEHAQETPPTTEEARPAESAATPTEAATAPVAPKPASQPVVPEAQPQPKAEATPEPAPEKPSAPSPTAITGWDDEDSLDWPMPDAQVAANAAPAEGAEETLAFGTGGANGVTQVWQRLSTYQDSYLKTWRGSWDEGGAANPSEVVDAFNEVAFAVTGPNGFWRNTLPKNWLGCEANPDSPPCTRLGAANSELARWDGIQARLSRLSPGRATRFLNRNRAKIIAYFDTYVPMAPNASAMKETGFYQSTLDGVLD